MEGDALTATTYFVRVFYDGPGEEIPDEDVAVYAKSQANALIEARRLYPEADRYELISAMRVGWKT